MGHLPIFSLIRDRFFARLLILALTVFVAPACRAQNAAPVQSGKPAHPEQTHSEQGHPEQAWTQEIQKYPGLPEELSRLLGKLRENVHFPAARTESALLPLLPKATVAYVAIPNYGDAVAQALQVFHEELQESQVLRDWYTHGQFAAGGPKLEKALTTFSELHEYLGEEIVLSAAMEVQEPTFLIVSRVRKPGLQKFLLELAGRNASNGKPAVRVLDVQQLATATERPHAEEPIVVVEPDFVVAALDLPTLRAFNTRLDASLHEFPATAFGERMNRDYQGGVTVAGGADVHRILEKTTPAAKDEKSLLQRSGFGDMQYLVWDHKNIGGRQVSETELSFRSPRHSAAAWLAKPRTLGSVDYLSPGAIMALAFAISDPVQVYEESQTLGGASYANATAAVPAFEKTLKVSVKDDLLALLSGEMAFEMDSMTPPQPVWKAVLGVKDATHLQQTLTKMLAAANIQATETSEDGVTYYSVRMPSPKTSTEMVYAYRDGYLVVGSSRGAVEEAIRLHRSGGGLAKSPKFVAALPPGRGIEASAMFYQNAMAMTAQQMRSLMPQLAESLSESGKSAATSVIGVYAEDSSLRSISSNSTFDAAGVLVVAAIAIPNLLRSKIAANEASAVGSVRTVNTAQVVYAASYPKRGYAPNLAALGPDPNGATTPSPTHAGIVDDVLGNATCKGDAWCVKSGYRIRVTSVCKVQNCSDYVVVASPVSESTGTRNFCSTSDGVIHYKMGAPVTAPGSVAECRTWPVLQ